MTNYAVFLHGENFEIHYEGKKQAVGFFTTVHVEAETEEIAGHMAVEVVESDLVLSEAFAPGASAKPDLQIRVIHELEPDNKMKNTKYTFFAMDEV